MLNDCICINVSKKHTYKSKIPPQVKSVPTILDTSGQYITGSFVKKFVDTVLPQRKNSDPTKTPRHGEVNMAGNRPQNTKVEVKSDDLQSANFGTEFSIFSYLPGMNEQNEDFTDFEYLNGMNRQASTDEMKTVSASNGGKSMGDALNSKLEQFKKARSQDLQYR